MEIMFCRYQMLKSTVEAYQEVHVPLILKAGTQYSPSGFGDDIGIYLFIPWLSRFWNVPLEKAIDLFFYSMIGVGFFLSLVCFGFLFKDLIFKDKTLSETLLAVFAAFAIPWAVLWGGLSINRGSVLFFSLMAGMGWLLGSGRFPALSRALLLKVLAGSGLFYMAAFAAHYGDVYVTEMFCSASVVPLFLVWQKKGRRLNLFFWTIMAFSGLVVGFCDLIHSQGGTAALLFVLAFVGLSEGLKWRQKLPAFLVLLFFMAAPYALLKSAEIQRDGFLAAQIRDYRPDTKSHPIWHSIYIGLGFIPNKYNIQYLDQSGMAAAQTVDPKVTLYSDEYNHILRGKIFQILKMDFGFVVEVVLAKAVRLMLLVGVFANIGIFLCWKLRFSMKGLTPFVLAGLFYALPGLLVIPTQRYVLGLISLSIIFCVYLAGTWLEKVSARKMGTVL